MKTLISLLATCAACVAGTTINTATVGTLNVGIAAEETGTFPTTGLVAWWKLDETSGTRTDSVGSNNLTAYNTPSYTTGIQGNACTFVSASTQQLLISDNADLSTEGGSFSVCAWVNLSSKAASKVIAAKDQTSGAGTREWQLYYQQASDRFRFIIFRSGTETFDVATADTLGSPSTSTWYFVVGVYDTANNLVKISVNGGAFDTTAATTDTGATSAQFCIGAVSSGASAMDGYIDEVGFWNDYVLTSDDVTYLYNGGSGRTYTP